MDALQRSPRVRFKHPVRVSLLEGSPRIVRTLTSNLSRQGLFVRMPEPLPAGARVALSFEAGGQALPFAEGEVVWCRTLDGELPGHDPGFGVRFRRFLHPRAQELVDYLLDNLDRGRPLTLPKRRWRWGRVVAVSVGGAAAAFGTGALLATALLGGGPTQGDHARAEALARRALGADLRAGAPRPEASAHQDAPVERGEGPGPAASSEDGAPDREAAAGTEPGERSTASGGPIDLAQPPMPGSRVAEAASPGGAAGGTDETVPGSRVAEAASPGGAAAGTDETVPGSRAAEAASPRSAAAGTDETAPGNRADGTGDVAQPGEAERPPANRAAEAASPGGAAGTDENQAAGAVGRAAGEPLAQHRPLPPPRLTEQRGEVPLPSGAVQAIAWALVDRELRVAPQTAGGTLKRLFVLDGPPRVVFDVEGAAPRGSHTVAGATPFIKQVRVGRQGDATRVVLDLKRAPADVSEDGDAFILSF